MLKLDEDITNVDGRAALIVEGKERRIRSGGEGWGGVEGAEMQQGYNL